jgi:hypothetical protein
MKSEKRSLTKRNYTPHFVNNIYEITSQFRGRARAGPLWKIVL